MSDWLILAFLLTKVIHVWFSFGVPVTSILQRVVKARNDSPPLNYEAEIFLKLSNVFLVLSNLVRTSRLVDAPHCSVVLPEKVFLNEVLFRFSDF